jgi:2-isopropylmalate synthase
MVSFPYRDQGGGQFAVARHVAAQPRTIGTTAKHNRAAPEWPPAGRIPSTTAAWSIAMQRGPITKYRQFPPIDLPDRQWPSRVISAAPTWCSVDLRDGNQALAIPMSVQKKLDLFALLTRIGFKEIEVGFPAASQIEFDFIRALIEDDLVPADVTIQVLVQAREELIRRTFECIEGAKRAIVHLYNSTNPVQRRVVFGLEKPAVIEIATGATRLIKELAAFVGDTELTFQYSPESFSLTEIEFSLEICEAVVDVWQPTPEQRIILNLPATVESATPNIHADQIEWFCRHLRRRDTAIISLHTHNDRGTGIAATELGLLAGGERVEGTLFGNGERTGNADLVTLALNLYTQGIDPGLNLDDLDAIRRIYEHCTLMSIHPRHPYAGELVFTAFSGSHQDAIKKGMDQRDRAADALWEVPYLPLDPRDIGRTYEAIIRINSQSGKGGVAYVLGADWGFQLPREMQRELGKIVNNLADTRGVEIASDEIFQIFQGEYLERTAPLMVEDFRVEAAAHHDGESSVECVAVLSIDGSRREIRGHGNGPIDGFVDSLRRIGLELDVISFAEHSLGHGAGAHAVAYVQIELPSGDALFGAAVDTDIEQASIVAVVSAVNRAIGSGKMAIADGTAAAVGSQ